MNCSQCGVGQTLTASSNRSFCSHCSNETMQARFCLVTLHANEAPHPFCVTPDEALALSSARRLNERGVTTRLFAWDEDTGAFTPHECA